MNLPELTFDSVTCPTSTPLCDNKRTGYIDIPAIGRIVKHTQDFGTVAILALGTTGEGHVLTETQHRVATEAFIEAGRTYKIPTIINVTGPTDANTLLRLSHAHTLKPDAILFAPLLGGAQQREVIDALLRGAVDCPVFLYEYPAICDNNPIPDATIKLLAQSDSVNLRGIKLSGCDLLRFRRISEICTEYNLTFQDGDEIRERSHPIWTHPKFGGTVASGAGISPIYRLLLRHQEFREIAVELTNSYTGDRAFGQGPAGLKEILSKKNVIDNSGVFPGTFQLYKGGKQRISDFMSSDLARDLVPEFVDLNTKSRIIELSAWVQTKGRDQALHP